MVKSLLVKVCAATVLVLASSGCELIVDDGARSVESADAQQGMAQEDGAQQNVVEEDGARQDVARQDVAQPNVIEGTSRTSPDAGPDPLDAGHAAEAGEAGADAPHGQPDASCPMTCAATASACGQTCATTLASCISPCSVQSCKKRCQTHASNCKTACVDACTSCLAASACPMGSKNACSMAAAITDM